MDLLKVLITRVINHWDPLDIGFGFEDEYNGEVNEIMRLLEFSDDTNLLAEGIYKIFFISGSSSNEEYKTSIFKKPYIECFIIALYIRDAILLAS